MTMIDSWYDGGSKALAFQWHFKFENGRETTIFKTYMKGALPKSWQAVNMTEPAIPNWVTRQQEFDKRQQEKSNPYQQWQSGEEKTAQQSTPKGGGYGAGKGGFYTPYKTRGKGKGKGSGQCYQCGEYGHIARNCPAKRYNSPRKVSSSVV